MKHDRRNGKIFPQEVSVADISWTMILVSSINFHIMVGLCIKIQIINSNAVNQIPINFNCIVSLRISITLCTYVRGEISFAYHSINIFLFNNDIVPSFEIDVKEKVIISILIYRVCEGKLQFLVRTDHRDKRYSVSIFTTIACTSISFKS